MIRAHMTKTGMKLDMEGSLPELLAEMTVFVEKVYKEIIEEVPEDLRADITAALLFMLTRTFEECMQELGITIPAETAERVSQKCDIATALSAML